MSARKSGLFFYVKQMKGLSELYTFKEIHRLWYKETLFYKLLQISPALYRSARSPAPAHADSAERFSASPDQPPDTELLVL